MGNMSDAIKEKDEQSLTLDDPVTGLATKGFLDIRLDFIISDAKKNKEKVALVRIILNHKAKLEDEVYKKVARILKRQTRLNDFLARYSKKEFVVILTDVDKSLAEEIVTRLKKSITDEIGINVEIGMALYQPGMRGNELMENAKQAISQ